MAGMECRFASNNMHECSTVFLDTPVTEGVFWWEVRIAYARVGRSSFCFGAAPAYLLSWLDSDCLGYVPGTPSFAFESRLESSLVGGKDTLQSSLIGVKGCLDMSYEEVQVADGSLVAIEADGDTGTLCFFVNGKKILRAVTDMDVPMHVGISGWKKPSCTTVSFRRLPSVLPSSVTPKKYKVYKGYDDDGDGDGEEDSGFG